MLEAGAGGVRSTPSPLPVPQENLFANTPEQVGESPLAGQCPAQPSLGLPSPSGESQPCSSSHRSNSLFSPEKRRDGMQPYDTLCSQTLCINSPPSCLSLPRRSCRSPTVLGWRLPMICLS